MTREQTIQHYMAKLGLTYDEAEELYNDEQNDKLPDLTPEQKKAAKQMTQADRKKEVAPRRRVRKPDADKRTLIKVIANYLDREDATQIEVTNPERQIDFLFNGEAYRIILSKPRKGKS